MTFDERMINSMDMDGEGDGARDVAWDKDERVIKFRFRDERC